MLSVYWQNSSNPKWVDGVEDALYELFAMPSVPAVAPDVLLAFVMGTHRRLGVGAACLNMSNDLMKFVCDRVTFPWWTNRVYCWTHYMLLVVADSQADLLRHVERQLRVERRLMRKAVSDAWTPCDADEHTFFLGKHLCPRCSPFVFDLM